MNYPNPFEPKSKEKTPEDQAAAEKESEARRQGLWNQKQKRIIFMSGTVTKLEEQVGKYREKLRELKPDTPLYKFTDDNLKNILAEIDKTNESISNIREAQRQIMSDGSDYLEIEQRTGETSDDEE